MDQARRDSTFARTKVLPGAGATNLTDVIDLESVLGDPGVSKFLVEIAVPAVAGNTDSSKSFTLSVHDSANNSSFAALAVPLTLTVPGVTSTGSVAITKTFRLPPDVRRYIKFSQTAPSVVDVSAATIAYDLLF
jgi:hypothetical protein